jgi:hypothetical protein
MSGSGDILSEEEIPGKGSEEIMFAIPYTFDRGG